MIEIFNERTMAILKYAQLQAQKLKLDATARETNESLQAAEVLFTEGIAVWHILI
jgi:hypothetical protein